MRKHFHLLLLLLLSCTRNQTPVTSDVCIYGNSSASVIAAVQLKKLGRHVVIVNPDTHLGGMSIEGLGGSDINNHADFKNSHVIGGLTLEFYREVAKHYGIKNFDSVRNDPRSWRFEPHVAEDIFTRWLTDLDIPVYKMSRLIHNSDAVKKIDNRIISFQTENGLEFKAAMFMDCSYEGDLLHYAGISTTIGREPNSQYRESKNGIRTTNTYRNFEVKVDPYIVPGQPESGVIHTIADEPIGEEGAGDKRIQAYCFRACLTRDSANRVPFRKPDHYDRNWYEIYLRYIRAGGKLYHPAESVPHGKTDLGAWHDLSHNLYGMNHAYPGGTYAQRDSIYQYHLDFTQGLFYFLANDTAVATSVRDQWREWGTTKDEFTDNNGWPRMLYIRDGRRMISDYVITEHNTRKDTTVQVHDPVGISYWPPDVHHVRRIVKDGSAYNEGFVFGGNSWKPFGISYRSLVPRKTECTNIITPTCLSSSHIAFGAIRLEWTFMIIAQSAAIAADLCLENGLPVQDVPQPALADRLRSAGQIVND